MYEVEYTYATRHTGEGCEGEYDEERRVCMEDFATTAEFVDGRIHVFFWGEGTYRLSVNKGHFDYSSSSLSSEGCSPLPLPLYGKQSGRMFLHG